MKEKKIFLIRHAKAEESSYFKNDFSRNLRAVGKEKAKNVAMMMKDEICIDNQTIVLSSAANRAIQTAEIFCKQWNFSIPKIIQLTSIYEASYFDILREINKVNDEFNTLILFGHNPGLSSLTNYVCNTYINLSTSGVAAITLEDGLHFSELSENTAHLNHLFGQ